MQKQQDDQAKKDQTFVPNLFLFLIIGFFVAIFVGRPLYDKYHDEAYRRCPNCTIAIDWYATKCRACKSEFKEGMTMKEIREFVEEGKD